MVDPHSITQADLARLVGVTQKTVSRVFATPALVAEPTRARVLAAAAQAGYRPHASARAMRNRRSGQVVLLQSFQPSASQLPAAVLEGLLTGLAEADLTLGIARFGDDIYGDEDALPKAVAEVACDGVIVNYDTNVPEALERALARHRIPAVWLNSKRDFDAVRPDDVGLAAALVHTLHELGHSTLLYADANMRHTPVCHYSRLDRLDGARRAAQELHIVLHEWLPERPFPTADYGPDMAAYLRTVPDVSAVIGYGSEELATTLRGAYELGRIVPTDLALATFSEETPWLGLSITYAQLPSSAIGRALAAALVRKLKDPGIVIPALVFPGNVVRGASTPHKTG